MPRVKDQPQEERENKMFEIFQKFYANPANEGKDLSIAKANAEFVKLTGAMLRNKKAYEIRHSVKVQRARAASGQGAPKQVSAARGSLGGLVEASSQHAASLIQGNSEQLRFLKNALDQLTSEGLCNLKVDHATDAYAVVARS